MDKTSVIADPGLLFGLVEPGPNLRAIWPRVVTFIAAALEHSLQHEWTTSEVYERIDRGQFLLAVVARDGDVIAGQVFEIGTDPGGQKYVAIVCSGGLDMFTWLPGMVALGKFLAVRADAKKVVILGRRGWARVLQRYGLKIHSVVACANVADIEVTLPPQIVGDYKG